MRTFLFTFFLVGLALADSDLERARDQQDRPALDKLVASAQAAAQASPKDAQVQYRSALASSYLAEIALELRDKAQAQRAAEAGIDAAGKAVALQPKNAEYHRVLATLYGQVIPASPLSGLSYGRKAKESIAKAVELDPKSASVHIAEGVGNYYVPPMFGGGPELAVKDFQKAIELDPKSSEAQMWLGIALRKLHRNTEARQAFAKAVELNPRRIWAKEQLEKTPAK